MKKRTVIGALGVIKKGNKFLMARRYEPDHPAIHQKWEFPGGEVEFNERPEETLLREVEEEVGLKVKIIRLIPYTVVHYIKFKEIHYKLVFFIYLCQPVKGKAKPSDSEINEVKWFLISEIDLVKCLPFTKEILESVLKLKM